MLYMFFSLIAVQKAAAEVATNALTDVYGTTYKVHVSALMCE